MASGYSFDFLTTTTAAADTTPGTTDQELADTSQFLYDSPQPEHQSLPSASPAEPAASSLYAGLSAGSRQKTAAAAAAAAAAAGAHTTSAHGLGLSPASEQSSATSSVSSAHRNQTRSSTSSPPDSFNMNNFGDSDNDFKMEKMFDAPMDSEYDFDSSTFPMGEQGMHDLSLNSMDPSSNGSNLDFSAASMSPGNISAAMFGSNDGFSPRNMSSLKQPPSMQTSPQQMTVQPSKMFTLNDSREDSPNSAGNMNSHEGTPPPFYNTSPMTGNADGFISAPPNAFTNPGRNSFGPVSTAPVSNSANAASSSSTSVGKWPCELIVDPTPEKSRVETQIPIRLTLSKLPPGITRLHLPSHTISKPKFQTKPAHQLSEDCLELSTMLVCASAMQRGQEIRDRALERALSDEIPVRRDENASAQDENDPSRPLNGGPVTICSGCIVRERKRAARKKTKKQEEEEEWAKDEAKRVIVFNCAENRDWCIPGTKETPVRESDRPLDSMFVHAPMRIACYCRHQSEKVGFQVIFTLKNSKGQVIAQAMSNSIMITDDHKQPMAQPGAPSGYALTAGSGMPAGGIFTSGQAYSMIPTFQQDMPFRTSFSTNDLQSLRMQLQQPQYGPPHAQFQRQMSNGGAPSEHNTTATATPRNLSRPASPTDPSGHSTKKRRSGGGLNRVSSGLTMTRIDTTRSSPANGNGPLTGPTGAPQSTFSFTSGTGFNSPMDQRFPQQALRNPNFHSGPGTPLNPPPSMTHGPSFGSPQPEQDPYQYYSAPTSQHASRAPSPSGGHRVPPQQFQNQQIPQQAASALSTLPSGFNLHNPPIIERVIPAKGSKTGGDEVTILGSGFCKGLDVVFGENTATNTVFWGDSAISCRSPPSTTLGQVQVLFKHQHHTAPPEIRQVQALMPQNLVSFCYLDDGQPAAMFNHGFGGPPPPPPQAQAMMSDGGPLSPGMQQDGMARHFMSGGQQGFANFPMASGPAHNGRMPGR